jgi:broad specificity phosphatase PhoE
MSTLLVVRHGQASFGAEDYDQLSDLGYEQSERLGAYIADHDRTIDAVYCGPAKRHRQTVEGLRRAPGLRLPETTFMEDLAELPAFRLVAMHGKEQGLTSFQEIIEAWMSGSIDCGDLETADEFSSRVHNSFLDICEAQGRGKTVLVVTSGGPTMVATQRALSLDVNKAADLLWVIANSSVSEFRYRDDDLSLVGFNRIAHLRAEHITYR